MKTTAIAFVLGTIALLGCSSTNEYPPLYNEPYDAMQEVAVRDGSKPVDVSVDTPKTDAADATKDAAMDATMQDAGFDATETGFVLPDAPPPSEGGVYPVNTDAGLARAYVSNNLTVGGSYTLPAASTFLSSTELPTIISAQIASGAIPYDPDGVYYFLTSAEIDTDNGGFCGWYCGYHNPYPINMGSGYFHYAMTGDTGSCLVCGGFPHPSLYPNGSLSADTMVSIIAHELAESATDPMGFSRFSWKDGLGYEVGDVCIWTYGQVYSDNGAPYNVEIGSRKFLIQQMWALTSPQKCVLDLNGDPGFDVDAAVVDDDSGVADQPLNPNTYYGMLYWGGPVLSKPIKVYWIWYGEWKNRTEVEPIITDFINGLGASSWWNILSSEYFDEPALLDSGMITTEGGAE